VRWHVRYAGAKKLTNTMKVILHLRKEYIVAPLAVQYSPSKMSCRKRILKSDTHPFWLYLSSVFEGRIGTVINE
jgi:hypothetical protein